MTKTTLNINGMACSMCESHMNDTIRKNFSVKSVKSSYQKGQSVVISKEPLDEVKLKKAIADTGYQVTAITAEPYEKKGLFR